MFQFSGLSPLAGSMVFNHRGCPIRTSADQSSFATPRSFSQLTTSFVVSESLGIPHTLLFASYSFVPCGTKSLYSSPLIEISNKKVQPNCSGQTSSRRSPSLSKNFTWHLPLAVFRRTSARIAHDADMPGIAPVSRPSADLSSLDHIPVFNRPCCRVLA